MFKHLPLIMAVFFFLSMIMLFSMLMWYFGSGIKPVLSELNKEQQSPVDLDSLSSASPPMLSPQWPEDDQKRTYTLTCRVVDPQGNNLAGVTLSITSMAKDQYSHSTKTDEEGTSHLMVIRPGTYRLRAVHPHYAVREETVSIPPRAEHHLFRILALENRTFTLKGRVITHAGQSVSQAMIQCIPQQAVDRSEVYSTRSRRNGLFEVNNLPAGMYIVSASLPGYLPFQDKIILQRNRTHIIALDRLARLDGVVTDEENHPIAHATVTLSSGSTHGTYSQAKSTTRNGRFTFFHLPAQPVAIHVSANGYMDARKEVAVTESTHKIHIKLSTSLLSIQGRVFDPRSNQGIENVEIELFDRRIQQAFPSRIQSCTTGKQGLFQFDHLVPAVYTIRPASQETEHYAPASWEIDLKQENRNVRLPLLKYGSVSGRVVNEENVPVPGAEVGLFPWNPYRRTVKTNSEGYFEYPYLFSSKQSSKDASEPIRLWGIHPDYALGISQILYYKEGSSVPSVTVSLTDGYRIHGRVSNAQYRPLPKAKVLAYPYRYRSLAREAEIRPNGYFTINHVASEQTYSLLPGSESKLVVEAYADGYELQRRILSMQPFPSGHLNILLQKGKVIAGQVLLPDASPASGARLFLMGTQLQVTRADRNGFFGFNHVNEVEPNRILAFYGRSRYASTAERTILQRRFDAGAYAAFMYPLFPGNTDVTIQLQPENGIVGTVLDGLSNAPINDYQAVLSYRSPQQDSSIPWPDLSEKQRIRDGGEFSFCAPFPGEYLLTIEADGYLETELPVRFWEHGCVKELTLRLTRKDRGLVDGDIYPYTIFSNIKQLVLKGNQTEHVVEILADTLTPLLAKGHFYIDNVEPGSYTIDCIYENDKGEEERKSLVQMEVKTMQSTHAGVLDCSSFFHP